MYHVKVAGELQRVGGGAPELQHMAPLAFFASSEEARKALSRAISAVASWAALDPDRSRAARAVRSVEGGEVVTCSGGYREQGLFGPRCNCIR